jgi:hypothetical protein
MPILDLVQTSGRTNCIELEDSPDLKIPAYANSTGFRSVPILVMLTSTFAPGVRYLGGLNPDPTPISSINNWFTFTKLNQGDAYLQECPS